MQIFTLGYQGLRPERYGQTLVNAGVGLVIDVRENAWSQRPEFIKGNLRASLLRIGIQYEHMKDAGNPTSNRKSARSAAECLRRYKLHLRENENTLTELLTTIRTAAEAHLRVCLTCFERDANECHRSVITAELKRAEPSLRIENLTPTITDKPKRLKTKGSLVTTAFLNPRYLPFR